MLIPVLAEDVECLSRARAMAETFGLPWVAQVPADSIFVLALTQQRLVLRALQERISPIAVDFVQGALAYRSQHGGREAIVRAVGCKQGFRPTVVDATAGLGRDGFILARAGCQVLLLERAPALAALLADGLARLYVAEPELRLRLRLQWTDSQTWLQQACAAADARPDVVYLDPMYPPQPGKSALNQKEMRLFRAIAGSGEDAGALLPVARRLAARRVVVKRARQAPPLADCPPDFSLTGGSTRFDVYLSAPRGISGQ